MLALPLHPLVYKTDKIGLTKLGECRGILIFLNDLLK